MEPPSPPLESAFQGAVCTGDLFEVLGENENRVREFWYAKVVGIKEKAFEVLYLVRAQNNPLIWVFDAQWQDVPWESVNKHVPVRPKSHEPHALAKAEKRAWKELGYRDLGDGGLTRVFEENYPSVRAREAGQQLQQACSEEPSLRRVRLNR